MTSPHVLVVVVVVVPVLLTIMLAHIIATDAAATVLQYAPQPQRTEIVVFSKFVPPVQSFHVPYPDNNTWIYCGQYAFLLQMLCERLHLRASVDTNTELGAQMDLYHGFDRFRVVAQRFLRLFATENYVRYFNQR